MNMNVDFFRAIEEFVGRWIMRVLIVIFFICMLLFGG